MLGHEYALHSEERAALQWKAIQGDIVRNLEVSANGLVPAPKEALKQARLLSEIFKQFDYALSNDPDLLNRQRNLVFTQIQNSSQVLADSVHRWNIAIDKRIQNTEQKFRLLSPIIPFLMLMVLTILAFLFNRRVLQPLSQLNKAVSAVAKGDLTVRSATAHKDEFGELSRTFDAMAIDLVSEMKTEIADRKRYETELQESRAVLEEAELLANTGSWTYDPVAQKSTWSKGMYRIWGLDPAIGLFPVEDHQKYIHPDDYPEFESVLNEAVQNGKPYNMELRLNRPDGNERTIIIICEPLCDETGKIVRLRGSIQDITDRKLIEEKVIKGEYQFRALFDEMTEGVAFHSVIRDDSGAIVNYRIEKVNPAYTDILGLSPEEVTGKLATEVYGTDTPPSLNEYATVVESRKSMRYSTYVPHMDRHFDISAIPWESNGFATIFFDITAKIKGEESERLKTEQLQHTQKLESLGVLSGGIAHDFNNILAIIIGNCGLAKMDSEKSEDYIPEIEKAAERAAGLCRQMMAYAGKAQLEKSQVNMRHLVGEMITMLNATLPKNAVIKPDLSADIPILTADDSQIRQIVMNLIINASEAIGIEQGEVRVSLTMASIKAGQVDRDYNGKEIPPGRYICLEVTDNGSGMDEETKLRIFEPFYTTKFTGRGLGMSAVLGIIKSHGGSLQLFSQRGQGTTFKVYLPVQNNNSTGEVQEGQSAQTTPWQGSGTILLVEDEDQIRNIAKTLLLKFGFTVLEAVNGKEAMEIYRKNARDIILVLTDIGMPVMDGYALFYELKMLDPKLPVIISSGFGEGDVTARIAREDITRVINKPYNPNQLREVLKSVLEVG